MAPLLTLEHVVTVAVSAVMIAALVAAARLRPGVWLVTASRVLAIVILVNEASWWVWAAVHHQWAVNYALPLQLCDFAAFVSAAALWFRRPLLVELTYFWGLAGTTNGIITPDLGDHFPSYLFFQYYVAHGAIVCAALFLVVGLRIAPRPWAALRMAGLTAGLAVLDGGADVVLNGNYMYRRHAPGVHSLLDLMGPWPWYLLAASGLALVFFFLLDLPFTIGRRFATRRLVTAP